MKLRNIGLPLVVLVASIAVGEECSDGMCKLSSDKKGSTSLDAVPSVNIKSIAQGRRLPSLDDKTFALVGGSFMASVMHSELKRLILAQECAEMRPMECNGQMGNAVFVVASDREME